VATEDDSVDTVEVAEEAGSELVEDEVEEESREAEASPSSNTRQRAMAASMTAAGESNNSRGVTLRRSQRSSPFRAARGARPTPIVWGEGQSNRGESIEILFASTTGLECVIHGRCLRILAQGKL